MCQRCQVKVAKNIKSSTHLNIQSITFWNLFKDDLKCSKQESRIVNTLMLGIKMDEKTIDILIHFEVF
jgi:hypothetical protein